MDNSFLEFLHKIRLFEIDYVLKQLKITDSILEIGGGAGFQANYISQLGYNITSIDIESSVYSDNKIFPVHIYDGKNIPYPNQSFKVIFTSHVLEHITDYENFYKECDRVLKKDGIMIHVVPTSTWRFWTTIAHYINVLKLLRKIFFAKTKKVSQVNDSENHKSSQKISWIRRNIIHALCPPVHGEQGSFLSEIYYFSNHYWLNHFRKYKLKILYKQKIPIFYTGYLIFGKKNSLKNRMIKSKFLGSSSQLYLLSKAIG